MRRTHGDRVAVHAWPTTAVVSHDVLQRSAQCSNHGIATQPVALPYVRQEHNMLQQCVATRLRLCGQRRRSSRTSGWLRAVRAARGHRRPCTRSTRDRTRCRLHATTQQCNNATTQQRTHTCRAAERLRIAISPTVGLHARRGTGAARSATPKQSPPRPKGRGGLSYAGVGRVSAGADRRAWACAPFEGQLEGSAGPSVSAAFSEGTAPSVVYLRARCLAAAVPCDAVVAWYRPTQ
jgi:hypothetical protein